MKRMRILGLALVAVFALGVITAVGASAAEPEFYECHKEAKVEGKVHGNFSDKTCSTSEPKEEGKYRLQPGIGKKHVFKGKGGVATLNTPKLENEVACGKFKDVGENTSPTTQGKIVASFGKCESLGKKCESPGAGPGNIVTNNLVGKLGYINKAKKEVGVRLSPETGTLLAEFNCEGLEIKTSGAVFGRMTGQVNTFSKTVVQEFKNNGSPKFEQEIKNFEGGSPETLQSKIGANGPFESGQESTATQKGELLEIKA